MFADLGHFSVPSIQVLSSLCEPYLPSSLTYLSSRIISIEPLCYCSLSHLNYLPQIAFTFVVFPCLLLAYMGQAAYLMKHPNSSDTIFYDSVPGEIMSAC